MSNENLKYCSETAESS